MVTSYLRRGKFGCKGENMGKSYLEGIGSQTIERLVQFRVKPDSDCGIKVVVAILVLKEDTVYADEDGKTKTFDIFFEKPI
jgi:hypothetical protein